MKRFLFDTSALLTLRDNEPGTEQVANLLYRAEEREVLGQICFISLMEILYRVWKDEGKQAGRFAYEQVQSLPLTVIHETPSLLEKAAELKAAHRLSLADAWIAAAAIQEEAVLVHKDPEFSHLDWQQLVLPFKHK